MDQILQFLESLPVADFYRSVCLLIYSTCFGVLPNNNDISMAAIGIISHLKNLPPTTVLPLTISSWILGETTVYFLGYFFGKKILNINFIKKKMNEEKQNKIRELINENPLSLFCIIRITPVLRGYSILTIGSLGLKPRHFFSKHIPLLIFYSTCIFHLFYFLGMWIQKFFSEHTIPIMITMIVIWFSVLIFVGKRFIKKLN